MTIRVLTVDTGSCRLKEIVFTERTKTSDSTPGSVISSCLNSTLEEGSFTNPTVLRKTETKVSSRSKHYCDRFEIYCCRHYTSGCVSKYY